MTSWFGRRPARPLDGPAPTEAYREGQLDERAARGDRLANEPAVARGAIDDAYDRGRLDERRRRRGSPVLGLLVAVVVLVGALMLYLAARNGSFSSGGAVVDRNLTTAAQKAEAPLRGAADKAGNALQNAGQDLKQRAGSGQP